MKSYIIRNNTYLDFVSHEVFMNGKVEYCYYEKLGNSFVNKVYIIVGNNNYVGEFLENSIYVFCYNMNIVNRVISILEQEYLNLEYVFVLGDYDNYSLLHNLLSGIGKVNFSIIFLEEYFNIRNNKVKENIINCNGGSSKDYTSLIKDKKKDKLDWSIDKTYANYNGFNERLIDRNVKNIVQFKKGNGGNR